MTAALAAPDQARTAAMDAPTGLFLLDATGRATYVNPRLAELLGVPAEDLLDTALVSRLLGEARVGDAIAIADAFGLAEDGESLHHVATGAPGVEWLRVTAVARAEGAGTVGVVEDVTRTRRTDAARARARRLECLGVLAGGIAHDFNNLLVGIVGNATLAELDIAPDGDAASALADLRLAAERATELTGQLLFFAGRGAAPAQPVDALRALEEAVAALDTASRARLAREVTELPRVLADAKRLRELLLALLTNAIEASEATSDRVQVRAEVTTVDETRRRSLTIDGGLGTGRCVSVEITDRGVGMTAEALDRAFEPWVTTKSKRRGLGLAMSVGTLRAYRGALEATSAPGVGTTMRVLLPIDPATAALPAAAQTAAAPAPAAVLVVDDEPAVRDVTRRLLARQGFEVLDAASGEEGVQKLVAASDRVGCVLLDLTMPGMDGIETLRRMRAAVPAVKVVMTSGHTERELRDRLDGYGVSGYLEKPFDFNALLRAARAAMAS
ncbi:MAG: response regulator [Gemmatimonadetes bacterium]|nr:response regulator [Gemmatimonadota bacterium]